jgi:hypothetical protein
MTGGKYTPEQQMQWLTKQLKELQQARATIERFEKLTRKWLKKAQRVRK